jgi:hypothetical protein
VAARREEIVAWLEEALLVAIRDQLALPVLESQRAFLEREAEAALAEIVDAAVVSPEGGLRVRFAAAVRSALLGKRSPLLLLEPGP